MAEYSFSNPRPQRFPFPKPMTEYAFKDILNPIAYQKLTQTCKKFFYAEKIVVITAIIAQDEDLLFLLLIYIKSRKKIAFVN